MEYSIKDLAEQVGVSKQAISEKEKWHFCQNIRKGESS